MVSQKYILLIVVLVLISLVALIERQNILAKYSACSIHIAVNYIASPKESDTKASINDLYRVSSDDVPLQIFLTSIESDFANELPRTSHQQFSYVDTIVTLFFSS
jgi:hypothetical protein